MTSAEPARNIAADASAPDAVRDPLKTFAGEVGPFLKTAASWKLNDAFKQWGEIDKDAWAEANRRYRDAMTAEKEKALAERAATGLHDPLQDFSREVGPFLKTAASWRFTEAFDGWGTAVLREKTRPQPLYDTTKSSEPDRFFAFYRNLAAFLKSAASWRFTDAWSQWGKAAAPGLGHNSGGRPAIDVDVLLSAFRRLDRPWAYAKREEPEG